MKKRGLSPIIATVLLIAIVFVLAAIIFLWARGFAAEKVAKFGEPVQRACDRVKFEAGIYDGGATLEINNQGEIPLFGFDVRKLKSGEETVTEYTEKSIGSGESTTIDISQGYFSTGDDLIVIPIVLGQADAGKVAYSCEDNVGIYLTV